MSYIQTCSINIQCKPYLTSLDLIINSLIRQNYYTLIGLPQGTVPPTKLGRYEFRD